MIDEKGFLTKILAIAGSVLVWFPILAPILLFMVKFIRGRIFHFDYLMAAELFPVILVGAGLLIWAAFRAHSRQRLIGWALFLATIVGSSLEMRKPWSLIPASESAI